MWAVVFAATTVLSLGLGFAAIAMQASAEAIE
jgi:hypothetical protein